METSRRVVVTVATLGIVGLGALLAFVSPASIGGQAAPSAPAQAPPAAPPEALSGLHGIGPSSRALYDRVGPSVLVIGPKPYEQLRTGVGDDKNALPTGFAVAGGYVLTDAEYWMMSSVKNPEKDPIEALAAIKELYAITAAGDSYPCAVVGRDLRNLLLVLKLPENAPIPALEWGDSDVARPGELVAALGNSRGNMIQNLRVHACTGSLSNMMRLCPQSPYGENIFEELDIDLADEGLESYWTALPAIGDPYRGNGLEFEGPIHEGMFGAPLVSLDGKVLGMISGHFYPTRYLGLAVPAAQLRLSFDAIVRGDPPPTPWFGFAVKNTSPDLRGAPAVTRVVPDSPAAKAGLKVGDRIEMIDGYPVKSRQDISLSIGSGRLLRRLPESGAVMHQSFGTPPGTTMTLTVRRSDALLSLLLRSVAKPGVKDWEKAELPPAPDGGDDDEEDGDDMDEDEEMKPKEESKPNDDDDGDEDSSDDGEEDDDDDE